MILYNSNLQYHVAKNYTHIIQAVTTKIKTLLNKRQDIAENSITEQTYEHCIT